jgi:hypothetical protein
LWGAIFKEEEGQQKGRRGQERVMVGEDDQSTYVPVRKYHNETC